MGDLLLPLPGKLLIVVNLQVDDMKQNSPILLFRVEHSECLPDPGFGIKDVQNTTLITRSSESVDASEYAGIDELYNQSGEFYNTLKIGDSINVANGNIISHGREYHSTITKTREAIDSSEYADSYD